MIPTAIDGMTRDSRVAGAIRMASARTGVDFSYLMHQARIESGFNPNARARTSSATGLFQFLDQTWLNTVKQHGAQHGLGWAAAAIQRGSNGRAYVADPTLRQQILDLRRQPEAASAMAAEFASDNNDYLQARIGRPVQSVDLYLAHFLGPQGAANFLRAHDANPGTAAAAVAPAAARANRAIFYNRDGSPRSLGEVRERFAARMGGAAEMPAAAMPATATPAIDGLLGGLPPEQDPQFAAVRMAAMENASGDQPHAGPTPQYARLAYLMLADLGG